MFVIIPMVAIPDMPMVIQNHVIALGQCNNTGLGSRVP